MTIPSFILGIIISSLYGAVYHLIRGGSLGRLLLYLIFSWTGFWVGQFLATRLEISFINVGPLHLAAATIGSITFLVVGDWLSKGNTEE
jgi:uncharacterized membrane protein YeaQ/YmgE (transglycosylase-associated protein family)